MNRTEIERLAAEFLRDQLSLVAREPRDRWVDRCAEIAGKKDQWNRDGDQEALISAIAEAAYQVGVAVGQRLRADAFDGAKGGA